MDYLEAHEEFTAVTIEVCRAAWIHPPARRHRLSRAIWAADEARAWAGLVEAKKRREEE
jgi:hypothetical protein